MAKSAADIIKRALTLVDERVTDILDASSVEMSLTDMAAEILPEVARNLIKELPYELKKYLKQTGALSVDPLVDGESQTNYVKKKIAFIPPDDFWELVGIRLKSWAKTVTSYILLDSPEYATQNNPFSRGGKQNPVAAVGTTNSNTTSYKTVGGYGALYNWYVTQDAKKITSSDDWVVPTKTQWEDLLSFLGGVDVAGGKLKEIGITRWDSPNTGADNSSGFTGIGGGVRFDVSGYFSLKQSGYYWSATPYNASTSYGLQLGNTTALAFMFSGDGFKTAGMSISLCNPNTTHPDGYIGVYVQNDGQEIPTIVINGVEYTMNLNETKFRDNSYIHGYDGGSYTPISNEDWTLLETSAMCFYNDDETLAIPHGEVVTTTNESKFRLECFSIGELDTEEVSLFEYISFNNYPTDINLWPDELFEKITKALASELNVIKGRIKEGEMMGQSAMQAIEQHE